jgi:hypothetical protein
MELIEIQDLGQIYPGEFLYHAPTKQTALCGKLNFEKGLVKARLGTGIIEAPLAEFRKIVMSATEVKASNASRCKGCSGRR